MKRIISLSAVLLSLGLLAGCERKVEDLEVWRTSEGGFEKLAEWAKSADEPDAVRTRALEILIEENQVSDLLPLFEGMADDATRAKFADAVFPTVDRLWKTQDQPRLTEEVKEQGGQVKIGDSKAVVGKDAAFFLQPFASARKADYEQILAQWMAEDQDLRTQLGATTIGQVMPRSGEKGLASMLAWLESTAKPASVQRNVMEFAKDDEKIMGELANVLVKRANEKHPTIEGELEVALLENNHKNLVPYIEKAMKDPAVEGRVKDGFMDAMVRIQGDKATPFFTDLVRTEKGLLRWVAAQRIIEVRGKAGVLIAANALPLEYDAYEGDEMEKDAEILCNFISTEMKELGIDSISSEIKRGLESERWPARTVALHCAAITKDASVKAEASALTSSKDKIAGWSDPKMTVGKFAATVVEKL